MLRVNNGRLVSGMIAALALTGLAARPADPPALRPGRWILTEWLAPHFPSRRAVLTVAEQAGQPTITAVEDDTFKWQPKGLTVAGRRVTFTITRDRLNVRFDGLFDPSNPNRILGSLWLGGPTMDRAVLELVPAGGIPKLRKPELPAEWKKYLELAGEQGQAEFEVEVARDRAKPAAEQAALRAAAVAAQEKYFAEVPKLFRKLVADQPDGSFGHAAALELLGMADRLKPTPAEINEWAKAARRFAVTHGPQFEAGMVGKIATTLTSHADYAAQARTYATEADKLAQAAGMPASYSATVAEYDQERAAWASQSKPPEAGATWTVTVTGKVTDAKGQPVPDAEVIVNNTQWGKRAGRDDYQARTGPDGRYTITLKCQGTYRLHVTQVWAEKRGFIRAVNAARHKLLPGQSATVDFTLKLGETFGGTVKVRPDAWERDAGADKPTLWLRVIGPGVSESVTVTNGEKFELTLPPGTYTVELDRGAGKKLTWPGLTTGRTDHLLEEPPFRFTPETVGSGFDQMWRTMDRNYSYFTMKPGLDWAKLRDEYRPRAVQAKSVDELAKVLAEMLGKLKDGHVWMEMPDGKFVGTTYRSAWSYNGNRKVVLAQLTDVTECGRHAVVGRTKPDGFGYFLMVQQSSATPELVAKAAAAIEKLADAPGFVIDLRTANGGNELLAQEIARLFCGKPVVYAKSRYRNGPGHDEFTEDMPRELSAAKSGRPYLKPVVCLLGPGCVSSGEGFAKMLAALPQVTTVGLPTRGSSGNPGPAPVGETGLVVYFSRWVDLLPDGTPVEGRGVPPKVVVDRPAADYRDADPTLARGLEVLRAKVAGGK